MCSCQTSQPICVLSYLIRREQGTKVAPTTTMTTMTAPGNSPLVNHAGLQSEAQEKVSELQRLRSPLFRDHTGLKFGNKTSGRTSRKRRQRGGRKGKRWEMRTTKDESVTDHRAVGSRHKAAVNAIGVKTRNELMRVNALFNGVFRDMMEELSFEKGRHSVLRTADSGSFPPPNAPRRKPADAAVTVVAADISATATTPAPAPATAPKMSWAVVVKGGHLASGQREITEGGLARVPERTGEGCPEDEGWRCDPGGAPGHHSEKCTAVTATCRNCRQVGKDDQHTIKSMARPFYKRAVERQNNRRSEE